MAADEGGDRTEQPTPRRRQEARERGQVPRSMDLTAALTLLGGLLLLNYFGHGILDAMFGMIRQLGEPVENTPDGPKTWLISAGRVTAGVALPFLLLLVVITTAGSLLQTGWLLTWDKLSPNIDKLNPVTGLRRMFSADSVTKLVMGLAKMTLIGAVGYFTIAGQISRVVATGAATAAGIMHVALDSIFTLGLRLGLVLLVLGIIDYMYQRWSVERSLRMTRQEVRDELKRMEGDPLMKQRRRQIQAKLALQRIGIVVPVASVVITNPTEFAVAIQYLEESMTAPKVLAKGKDFVALRIRQIAQQNGIPIVQRPPLARALYAACEPGQDIPQAYYRAVAEVLAYVYQLEGMQQLKEQPASVPAGAARGAELQPAGSV